MRRLLPMRLGRKTCTDTSTEILPLRLNALLLVYDDGERRRVRLGARDGSHEPTAQWTPRRGLAADVNALHLSSPPLVGGALGPMAIHEWLTVMATITLFVGTVRRSADPGLVMKMKKLFAGSVTEFQCVFARAWSQMAPHQPICIRRWSTDSPVTLSSRSRWFAQYLIAHVSAPGFT